MQTTNAHRLAKACGIGDLPAAKQVLSQVTESLYFPDSDFFQEALMRASNRGHVDVVEWLLDKFMEGGPWKGAEVFFMGPFTTACGAGQADLVRWWISNPGRLVSHAMFMQGLYSALRCGRVSVFRMLRDALPDEIIADSKDDSFIVAASAGGSLELVQWAWASTSASRTVQAVKRALREALQNGDVPVVEWLWDVAGPAFRTREEWRVCCGRLFGYPESYFTNREAMMRWLEAVGDDNNWEAISYVKDACQAYRWSGTRQAWIQLAVGLGISKTRQSG